MNTVDNNQQNTAARVVAMPRNPYQMERAIGAILWVGFFLVLLSLGD